MPVDEERGCDQISVQKSTGARGLVVFLAFEFMTVLGVAREGATVVAYK